MNTDWVESIASGMFSPLNIVAVLAAAAIVFIAWQAWAARPRVENAQVSATTIPPSDLHPAYAGALASGRVSDSQIEATVLELVRRGAVIIQPDEEKSSSVQIRVLDESRAVIPLESELLALLSRRSRDGVVNHNTLKRIRSDWGTLRRTLKRNLEQESWFNPSTLQTSLPFIVPGLIGISLAITSLIAAIVAGSGWPVLGAIIVGVTGLFVLGVGNVVPQTTRKGEQEALAWRGLRAGLARARQESHGTIDLDQMFPYIVAMGMAAQFDRYLRRASQSGYIPEWIGRRSRVQEWPEGWHTYWIALHTALAPTDPANTPAPSGSPFRRSITGGR